MADTEEMMLREDGSTVQVGDRVVIENHVATVRYIGTVPPTKGLWIGVEWDDPDRGKHDGSHDGKRYFTTRNPKSGSFIRNKKAELGMSLMAAVQDRYGIIDDQNAGVIPEELYVLGAKNKATVVEMVGAKKINEKQSKLEQLREVVLREMKVYGSHKSHDLQALVPSIRDLDLSRNLLPSWQKLADISKQLPNLRSLNVSENILEFPENPQELAVSFAQVKCLYLNRMSYDWNQVLRCMAMFPSLERLHLCFNSISSLTSINSLPKSIRLLNFESNQLQNWSEILLLGSLPRLETLILSSNKLSEIRFEDTEPTGTTSLFPCLISLTVNSNNISDWGSINELNKLAQLSELRIKSNPLLQSANPETVRQILIAKLQHLTSCSRTAVLDEERKGAEIDYLKRFGPSWVKSGGHQDTNKNNPSQEFIREHPRFNALVQKWGAPEDSEMTQQVTTLKSNLIPVKITCPSQPDRKALEKKLPGTMTVQKLKALIHRLYKLDTEFTLTYVSQKMPDQEIEMEHDLRFLTDYAIEAGDTIQVKV